MNYRLCLITLFLVLCSCSFAQTENNNQRWDRGQWSGETTALVTTVPGDWTTGSTQDIPSPDREKVIQVRDDKVFLAVQGKRFRTDFGHKFLAELGWSPDSSRFFVTWSDAGWGGIYRTQVYQISPSGMRELRGITDAAKHDFYERIRRLPPPKEFSQQPELGYWLALDYCEPNVVGAQWLKGSSELLISVLVPNTSACRYMQEFNVYRVRVPGGRILERYTAERAHRDFDEQNLPKIVR